MKYKLIAFDMDGTLLNSEKKLLPSSLRAIQEAANAKKYVSLSTGRSMPELEIFGNQLDIVPYIICASGALIYDNEKKQMISTAALEDAMVRELFERSTAFDTLIHLHSDKAYMQADKLSHIEDYHMEIYRPVYEKIITRVEDLRSYYKAHYEEIPVYKFNLYCRTLEDRAALRELLKDLPLELVDSEITSLECSPMGLSKAKGLRTLCEYLQTDMAETIAVGDADNDLEMLKAAGLSVAMGNANERVKQIADMVVASCDEGGCAEVIYDYLLKE